MRRLLFLLSVTHFTNAEEPFFEEDGEFGLKDSKGNRCLVARFDVELINFNVNSTNNRLKLDLLSASIGGHCAKDKKGSAVLTTSLVVSNRKRKLKFYFHADKLNITLRNPDYENVVLQFFPEIDVQPYSAEQGQSSNLYVCERTRKRSLAESFDSKMTVFSGVVLGLASIGMLIGHAVRRQLMPTRKRDYEELGQ